MIVLDAQAVVAYLTNEPAATAVRDVLTSGEQLLLSTVNLAEVSYFMARTRDVQPSTLYADIVQVGVHITRLDEFCALDAATLRLKHYHRKHRPVSMADCCAAALALDRRAALVSSDEPLLSLMIEELGEVVPVPASDGSLWTRPAQGRT